MSKVNVVNDEDIPKDVLATAICDLSDGVSKLLNSGLNVLAIVVLLKEETGLSKRNITAVLNALGELRVKYTHD